MLAKTQSHIWLDVAEDRAEAANNPKLYIGAGLAGALILGSLLNPLTAIATLAYGLYLAWDANEKNSDQIEAVEDGIIAHLLDEKQLRQYTAEVGAPQVALELKAAIARELPMSDAAEAMVKNLGKPQLTLLPPAPAPQPPAPTVGPATRLGAISVPAVPAAPVEPAGQQWDDDEIAPPATAVDVLQECLGYPAILIYGPSGSGKSTLAKWLIAQRQAAGHHCEILDPHAAYGAWGELPVYGGGMDYQVCDDRLVAFAELVKSRYQVLNSRPNFNPKPHTLLTEEFTNWASHCPHAGQFFASSMSDLRKVNMFAIYVAHGRTLTSLGGKSGVAEQRDQSLLEIELSTSIGPGGMPIPSGKAKIYYPGQKGSPMTVDVPKLAESPIAVSAKQQQLCDLESAFNADSSDDLVAAVREILIKAGEPLKASQIKQRSRMFKDGIETKHLEELLERMALEGFVVKAGETPPRFSVS